MKFHEILEDLKWEDVKEALLKNYEVSDINMCGYEKVFFKIKGMEPSKSDMRICLRYINEKDSDSNDDDLMNEQYYDIHGKNGTLNKNTEDAEMFTNAGEEWLNAETTYALEFNSWNEWLAMEIDEETANNIELTIADIASHCLWEMTFIDYDEEGIQERANELKEMVDNIKNMSPEELKKNTVSWDEIKEDIKKWRDEDDM